jgi:hypothetical protein
MNIMEYKVVPFIASIDRTKNAQKQVAEQLEVIIKHYTDQNWDYVRVESISSFVKPDGGCFGIGGNPGFTTSRQMVVFRKLS